MLDWPRLDVATLPVAGGELVTYRRGDELVVGPCMSLNVAGVEVMRFDLPTSPEGACHEHWAGLAGKPRLYYPASWSHAQCVELAVWNLVAHAAAACAVAKVPCPPRADLEAAAEWAAGNLTVKEV